MANLAFFEGAVYRSHQTISKRKRKRSVCCRNGILSFPPVQGPLPRVNSNSSRFSEAKDTSRVFYRVLGTSCLLELLDQYHLKLQIILTSHQLQGHPYSWLLLLFINITLALEPFLGQSQSTFQYCYSVNLFLENTGEGDFTTGEGDFFVFSGKIHKGKEKKKRID